MTEEGLELHLRCLCLEKRLLHWDFFFFFFSRDGHTKQKKTVLDIVESVENMRHIVSHTMQF